MDHQFSITIANKRAEISNVIEAFDGFRQYHDLSGKVAYAIELALDELISNIIDYAYEEEEVHQIQIAIELADNEISLQIVDDGRPFNPFSEERPVPDTQSPLEERPIGGLGLHLVTTLMDSYEYRFENGKNCLILKKKTNKS